MIVLRLRFEINNEIGWSRTWFWPVHASSRYFIFYHQLAQEYIEKLRGKLCNEDQGKRIFHFEKGNGR